ncbi:structural protein [Flavobacterium arcticum]|uniref:Structural protein n=1 Tax=Flavobacterium arcticum TaxID=1784713 RepID=A0A345H8M9_9FLAO|nr:structural protein [Flavobacterium arcticum]AXG72939.1 structural protein [Flavobacterium arcticum]KAF2510397.1 structural protein [Flavobacterium arcticum]
MPKSYLNRTELARGLRNNNPGNLIRTSIAWEGKIPHSNSADAKFEQFYELRYGIRAMMRNLITHINKGTNTIEKLISKYAPSFENNTTAYINSVVSALGIPKTATLDLSEETIIALCKIIAMIENGNDSYAITNQDYKDAIAILGIPLKKKVITA